MTDDKTFVHLHVHTEYSLLDGLSRIPKLVARAKAQGMTALAITDHGTMFGVIEFYRECMKQGLKPIIGLEGYLARRTMYDRDPKEDRKPYHLLLLAKNQQGYQNLLKIASAGQLEGYYYNPRIDREFLERHAEGLIATSGCLAAQIPSLMMQGLEDKAREMIDWYIQVFGKDNFFLELQDHNIDVLKTVNNWLIDISRRDDVRLLATNDVHYVLEKDYDPHDTLLCIQSSALKTDENRLKMSDNSYYLSSIEEMWKSFGHIGDGEPLHNTALVAEMCSVNLDSKGYHLPTFPVPEGYDGASYLRMLCNKGLCWRYGEPTPALQERLDYELSVIHDMGFDTYFLIVWDLCQYARKADIWWNVRGSGAGSMAAYCLGITNIDPIQNNLLFERFLNPGRVSMPDIDIDYPEDRRSEMIAYTARKYGEEKVAAIITFGTLGAKAAVRDVGRALGVPLEFVNQAAKLIPTEAKQKPLMEYVESNPDLKKLYETSAEIKQVIDTAKELQGVARHASTHAAGVIVADKPLVEYIPLHRLTKVEKEKGEGEKTEKTDRKKDKDDDTGHALSALKQVTQFDMETAESLGLLKIDFLGLSTLAFMRRACDLIKQHHGIEYNMDNIPYRPGNDPVLNRMLEETFELIGRGETIGVFQVESGGMQQTLRGMRPTTFEHVVAAIALYRPGPMDYIPTYNNRMHGKESIVYSHPKLEPILAETYSIIVYQEQIMQIASELFGYSLGEADLMRRAVSKKKKEDLLRHREIFQTRGPENGVDAETAGKIFDDIEFFANYGFNKCVTADTQVIDADTGMVYTIGDVVSGKQMLTRTISCSTDNLRLTAKPVTQVVSNGVKPVYRLTTRTGRTIKATDNHPFYTYEGWRQLSDLKPGDFIATPRCIPVEGTNVWEDYKLITLGHLLAEGNLCHTTGVYYYTGSDDQLEDYVEHIQMFENSVATVARHKAAYSVYSKRASRKQSQDLVTWIKALGLWGKDASEKFIPDEVFGLTNDCIALLLARMWEGDGHIHKEWASLHYTTASEKLARQMQHLLLRFGIVGRLHKKDYKYEGAYTGYELHITGRDMIQSFKDHVGHRLVHWQKRETLDNLLNVIPSKNGVRDIIPLDIRQLINQERIGNKLTWVELSERAGVAESSFHLRTDNGGKNGYQRDTIGKLGEALDSDTLRNYANSDLYWDEIVSIEYVGEEETFDLTVADTHNFVANDIIVHNSHAADYGVITVQTAFLKRHYPEEFMTALLSVYFDDTTKVTTFLGECKRLNIPILPPDVNYSMLDFDIQPDPRTGKRGIRFGMAAVKNAGVGALQHIIDARSQGGVFISLDDFCRRVDLRHVGKRALESLIKVGAMQAFGTRPMLLAALDRIMAQSANHFKAQETGQVSLFGDAVTVVDDMLDNLPNVEEASQREMLNWEKDLLGLYVSSHPIDPVMDLMRNANLNFTHELKDTDSAQPNQPVRMIVLITNVRRLPTRNNEMMAIAQIEDRFGTMDVVLFPRTWKQHEELMKIGGVVQIKGKLDLSRGDPQIICEEVSTDFTADVVENGHAETVAGSPPVWMVDDNLSASVMSEPPSNSSDSAYADAPPPPPTLDEVPPAWLTESDDGELLAHPLNGEVQPEQPPRWLVVHLRRSGDDNKDTRRLKKVYNKIIQYPGKDRFTIVLKQQGQDSYSFEFPNETTQCCESLLHDLKLVVGESNVAVFEQPQDSQTQ